MSTAPECDETIVADVLAGQRDRFAVLVERYQAPVFAAMWRLTASRDHADELTQEVFVRAYFALGTFKPEYKLLTWLIRIGYHRLLNEVRDRRREVVLGAGADEADDPMLRVVDPAPQPHAVLEARELARGIWDAVADLPEEFRVVVLLRHVEQLSYDEICDATGLPIGTVKSRLARGRRRLAEMLVDRL